MEYSEIVLLKNGTSCTLRSAAAADCQEVYDLFITTHAQTDFLLTYPEENTFSPEQEGEYLAQKLASPNEVEILAIVDGRIVGSAGIEAVGTKCKVRHRAEFGISILQDCWGLGIGGALTRACIACARKAGYTQLELIAVAENTRALELYHRNGFTEYGRNPKGFLTKEHRYQEQVLMRLDLE